MTVTAASTKVPEFTANALEYMTSLFDPAGNLPKLDIGQRTGETEYIDFILAEEMSHPMMKGTDRFGRHFFCMKSGGRVHTFFQRCSDSTASWTDAGSLVSFGDYLIDAGFIRQKSMEKVIALVTKFRSSITAIPAKK